MQGTPPFKFERKMKLKFKFELHLLRSYFGSCKIIYLLRTMPFSILHSFFRANLINIEGVISNFTHKAKSNFCHTYRVNRLKEQAKNWYLAWLNIRGVSFGGQKSIELETAEI